MRVFWACYCVNRICVRILFQYACIFIWLVWLLIIPNPEHLIDIFAMIFCFSELCVLPNFTVLYLLMLLISYLTPWPKYTELCLLGLNYWSWHTYRCNSVLHIQNGSELMFVMFILSIFSYVYFMDFVLLWLYSHYYLSAVILVFNKFIPLLFSAVHAHSIVDLCIWNLSNLFCVPQNM